MFTTILHDPKLKYLHRKVFFITLGQVMTRLLASGAHASVFSNSHFGGNILATRDQLGAGGTFDEAADFLNLDTIRYPGGSLTERYFDITDPDRTVASGYFNDTPQPLLPFSEFMAFAEQTGRAALIVLPTRTQLSDERDANGERFADVDEDALRSFIQDTLDGVYGSPRIAGFEIGNEYWDSGEMTAVEYGRVASEMALILRDELQSHPDYESRFDETQVHVQMGMNYGYGQLSDNYVGTAEEQLEQFMSDYDLQLEGDFIYSNGNVAWPLLANHLIMREFDLPEERSAIDAVVAHVYSRGEEATGSHFFALQTIDRTWGEEMPELETFVTEWNVRNRDRDPEEDFGLVQATEMLDVLEAMSFYGTAGANVWPVQQQSRSSLTGDSGDVDERATGVFFQMLSETLPGTRAVVLEGAGRRETELELTNGEVHAFAGDDRMVFYVTSTVEEGEGDFTLDFTALFNGFNEMEIERLGVADGTQPGAANALGVRTSVDPDEHYRDGVLNIALGPREILEITVNGVQFTNQMEATLELPETKSVPVDPTPVDPAPEPELPDTPPPEEPEPETPDTGSESDGEEDGDGGGGMDGLLLALAILPLLAFAGL